MKTSCKFFSIVFLSVIILSCKKKEMCVVNYSNIIKSDTLIDYNAASLHYREKVAVFKLRDNSVLYADADLYSFCGKGAECKAFLIVQNKTTQQININYKIILNSTPVYHGQTTIPPNGTVDIGQITDHCIYNAAYAVESTSITYF